MKDVGTVKPKSLKTTVVNVFGRLQGCLLVGGEVLYNQDLDEKLYRGPDCLIFGWLWIPKKTGIDSLSVEYVAMPGIDNMEGRIKKEMLEIGVISDGMKNKELLLGSVAGGISFAPSYTVKRVVLELRTTGGKNAQYFG